MQSEQSAGYLKWLVALAIFSPIVSAQTMTIAGQTHDCSWLPALDATLAYNGEGTFAGWTAQDVDSAKALITECERPGGATRIITTTDAPNRGSACCSPVGTRRNSGRKQSSNESSRRKNGRARF
jgi:hypothetical protein